MYEQLSVASAWFLALVFGVSAGLKGRSASAFRDFAQEIRTMRVVPPRLSARAAVLTLSCETALVVTLTFPRSQLIGLALASCLLGAYCLVLMTTIQRNPGAGCGCFGAGRPVGTRHVVRNLALVVVALAGAGASQARGIDTPWALPAEAVAVIVAVAAMTAVLIIAFDRLVPPPR